MKWVFLWRGFSGHEHLSQFGLINMNGRVYDPLVSRFLSPDLFVQAPGNPLSYNRYAYVFNNPLSHTDPSGYTSIQLTGPEAQQYWSWYLGQYNSGNIPSLNKTFDMMEAFGGSGSSYGGTTSFSHSLWWWNSNWSFWKNIAGNFRRNFLGQTSWGHHLGDRAKRNQSFGPTISPILPPEDEKWQNVENFSNNGGLFFVQAEVRTSFVFLKYVLGVTSSHQAGFIFDRSYNIVAYYSPTLGLSGGAGGVFGGVSVGTFKNASSAEEIKGLGLAWGYVYSFNRKGFSIEGNLAINGDDFLWGATFGTPAFIGLGASGYFEGTYTFISKPYNVLENTLSGFAKFLNEFFPKVNFSENDAFQILLLMNKIINL